MMSIIFFKIISSDFPLPFCSLLRPKKAYPFIATTGYSGQFPDACIRETMV